MKIGTTKKDVTGKTDMPSDRLPDSGAEDPRRQLAELADSTRREMIRKAGLQMSMKDKLLSSRKRADEIRQRIQDGYYTRPDILRSIADRVAEDM